MVHLWASCIMAISSLFSSLPLFIFLINVTSLWEVTTETEGILWAKHKWTLGHGQWQSCGGAGVMLCHTSWVVPVYLPLKAMQRK